MKRSRRRPRRNTRRSFTQSRAADAGSSWLLWGGLALGGLYLLSKQGSSPEQEQEAPPLHRVLRGGIQYQEEEAPPEREEEPARPARDPMVAERGLEAPAVVVSRVVGDGEYKNIVPFYMQAIPYVYGQTDLEPTGETESDRAMSSAAVIRRIIERDASTTWDGLYSVESLRALRSALQSVNSSPVRAIRYSFEPEIQGDIYAYVVAIDPKAVNVFDPRNSV